MSLLLASIAATIALWLSAHHPLSPPMAMAACAFEAALAFASPTVGLSVVFATLPLVDLAPWTGWITFEEVDLLVLAAAAGGYARLAWLGLSKGTDDAAKLPPSRRLPARFWLLPVMFGVSVLVAMSRGIADAGGWSFGWYQGLHEPLNSVRLAKPYFLALLLVPLWTANVTAEVAAKRLAAALMLGALGAGLAAAWEREAFTGLFDFSTDYRTTALFWEMNVGGAAFDGFLALTVPFALHALAVARTPWRWAVAAACVLVSAYACMTTFSRGVYLAIPVGAATFMWLRLAQARRGPRGASRSAQRGALISAALLLLGFGVAAAWMFPTSGYRGLIALLGGMALLIPVGSRLRGAQFNDWGVGVGSGIGLSLLAFVLAPVLPKGAYALYGAAAISTAVCVLVRPSSLAWTRPRTRGALAGYLCTVTCLALVALHWGDRAALWHALPVAAVLLALLVYSARSARPLWPDSRRWLGTLVAAMTLLIGVVGVSDGGSYMGDRFSTGHKDFDERLEHWRQGLAMLTTPQEQLLGKGLGRYPSSLFFSGAAADQTGDYRLKHNGDERYLTITGGKFEAGWGEIFRVSQRVPAIAAPATVSLDVRAERTVGLHFDVCEKHLLYNGGCLTNEVEVAGKPGEWQHVRALLAGSGVYRGAWYAPRLIAFSLGVASKGGVADVKDIQLDDAGGREVLQNGRFDDDLAHWFFSSDRYHLPWHIKSLFANVLFDQGAVGFVLLALLAASAFWRVTLGSGRDQPLAPSLAAAMIGFAVVGLFDSLLDVPRVAMLFYFLLLIAYGLRPRASAAALR